VRQPERNPDDRDAHDYAADEVPEREPPAGQDQPDDVPDDRQALAGARALDQRPPEWPETEARELHPLDPQRDGDDQDEHHERGDHVADGRDEPPEDQPDDVQQDPDEASLTACRSGHPTVAG